MLSRQGLGITAGYDGSGLSRSDRISSLELARIVDRGLDTSYSDLCAAAFAERHTDRREDRDAVGIADRVHDIAPGKCAAGKVWAKTGALDDVMRSPGGRRHRRPGQGVRVHREREVSNTLAMRRAFDNLAATVNGCY